MNLQTFEETRALPLMLGGALAALRTPEIAAMIAMPEEESRTRVRSFFTTVCLTGVCVSLLFTLISGVTGRFGETQRFQFFTLTSLARIGSTERMDDLLYAAWIFTALLRTAFYTALAAGCFRAAGMKGRLLPLITAGAAALAFGTALGADTPLRRCFEQTELNAAVCAVFSVLLPLLFLLKREPAAKKTGNRAGEEAAV